jgi:hypothetical protein
MKIIIKIFIILIYFLEHITVVSGQKNISTIYEDEFLNSLTEQIIPCCENKKFQRTAQHIYIRTITEDPRIPDLTQSLVEKLNAKCESIFFIKSETGSPCIKLSSEVKQKELITTLTISEISFTTRKRNNKPKNICPAQTNLKICFTIPTDAQPQTHDEYQSRLNNCNDSIYFKFAFTFTDKIITESLMIKTLSPKLAKEINIKVRDKISVVKINSIIDGIGPKLTFWLDNTAGETWAFLYIKKDDFFDIFFEDISKLWLKIDEAKQISTQDSLMYSQKIESYTDNLIDFKTHISTTKHDEIFSQIKRIRNKLNSSKIEDKSTLGSSQQILDFMNKSNSIKNTIIDDFSIYLNDQSPVLIDSLLESNKNYDIKISYNSNVKHEVYVYVLKYQEGDNNFSVIYPIQKDTEPIHIYDCQQTKWLFEGDGFNIDATGTDKNIYIKVIASYVKINTKTVTSIKNLNAFINKNKEKENIQELYGKYSLQ